MVTLYVISIIDRLGQCLLLLFFTLAKPCLVDLDGQGGDNSLVFSRFFFHQFLLINDIRFRPGNNFFSRFFICNKIGYLIRDRLLLIFIPGGENIFYRAIDF